MKLLKAPNRTKFNEIDQCSATGSKITGLWLIVHILHSTTVIKDRNTTVKLKKMQLIECPSLLKVVTRIQINKTELVLKYYTFFILYHLLNKICVYIGVYY